MTFYIFALLHTFSRTMCVRLAKDLIHEGQMHKLRHPNIVMLLAVIFEAQHYGVLFEYVIYGGLDCFVEDYQVKHHRRLT